MDPGALTQGDFDDLRKLCDLGQLLDSPLEELTMTLQPLGGEKSQCNEGLTLGSLFARDGEGKLGGHNHGAGMEKIRTEFHECL